MKNHKNAAAKAVVEKASVKKAAATAEVPELREGKPTLHKLDVVVAKAPKPKEE